MLSTVQKWGWMGHYSTLIINGCAFTPTSEPEVRTGFYLATGRMEIDGVEEDCVVTRDRRSSPFEVFFKHKSVESLFNSLPNTEEKNYE